MDGLHSTTLLNSMGDITIAWTPDRDAEVKEMIAKKMKEGYTFFIVTPSFMGKKRETLKIRKVGDIGDLHSITVKDEDADKLIQAGIVGMITTTDDHFEAGRVARSADDAVQNHTVATRPPRGG